MGTRSWANKTHLNAEVASVNVVSQEEIPRGSGVAADFEEFHQVVLAVDKFRKCVQGSTQGKNGPTYWP